jgi:magnesium chelatase subunit D
VNDQWFDALLAAACMAVAPNAVRGIQVRASAGPLRDYWFSYYCTLARTAFQKIPCTIDSERLTGGVDIAASLTLGKPVQQLGVLASLGEQTLILAMAERLPTANATLIAQAIDNENIAVIALDEGRDEEELIAKCLDDRLPVILTLGGVSFQEFQSFELGSKNTIDDFPIELIDKARKNYLAVTCDDPFLTALCAASIALGIDSMRAPIAALTLAKIHAALFDRNTVEEEDISFAVRIVLAPRATTVPQVQQNEAQEASSESNSDKEPEPPQEPPKQDNSGNEKADEQDAEQNAEQNAEKTAEQVAELQELVLQAAMAAIPQDLLASLQRNGNALKARSVGNSGAAQKGGRRGRATGVFRKKPDAHAKLHLLHTLRASIPWQRMRSNQAASERKVLIRKDDFRYQKITQSAKSTIVFAIDASGSSALNRLAEAKGAIELLLAQCYVRRDQVAVIAFRGSNATIILPPTRSLARAKRSLAGLPGGGGTPLAGAIECATTLAKAIQKKGETPFVVILTDGRANVSLSGAGGRGQAQEDVNTAAKLFYASNVSTIVLDTSAQPHHLAQSLASNLGATYLPLPYAGAQAISEVVQKSYRSAN